MKKTLATLMITALAITAAKAQKTAEDHSYKRRLGLRGGVNFNQVTNASSINTSSYQGFNAAAFWAAPHKGILGYRSEISFSRQGYDFSKQATTGTVTLDYILLPQLTTINITKFVQLQVGGQIGFLINSGADSSKAASSDPKTPTTDYFNKLTYGFVGGIEIYPVSRVFIGARMNVPLNPLNMAQSSNPLIPAYIPTDKKQLKNNVVLVYLGIQL